MAETITLRAYLNVLQGMVDNESPTEVVSHCRYILQHFPQNVATYRLLGKALLQKGHNEGLPEHFVQAADIFQRVLSVLPDDPIAHLALSEIREQEGAVEQATWHMERAQEQMPGNPLIRDALRKLYTRRTGREGGGTDKLQLSQGALARQYANSELYDEAILELRRALQAEPERVDLQVLLAKLLWESQHPVEAGEVAAEVLRRLPYCLEANALMARLWLAYDRPSDAQQFLDRVEALDPYTAMDILHPQSNGPDPNVLPRLDYTARAAASFSAETPEWVHELGDIDDLSAAYAAPGDVPTPLGAQSLGQIDTETVFGEQPAQAPPEWAQEFMAADEEMPDWFSEPAPDEPRAEMKPAAAPWLEGVDDEEAAPAVSAQTDAVPGDLPDWFSMVTGEDLAEAPGDRRPAEPVDEGDLFDAAVGDFAGAAALGQADSEEAAASDVGAPPAQADWFAELGNAASAEEPAAADAASDPRAWMRDEPEREAGGADLAAPDEAFAAAWLPFEADAEQPLTLEQWQQTIAAGDEPDAQRPDDFLAADDEIADLDRLFDALKAAEAAGDASDLSEMNVALSGEPAEPAEEAMAPADDWLAMFSEPEVSEGTPSDTESFEPPEPEWGAADAETLADDETTDAPLETPDLAAPEADTSPEPEAGPDAVWGAIDDTEAVAEGAAYAVAAPEPEDEIEQAPILSEAGAAPDDMVEQAAPVADEDLLDALSEAADDDDWLRSLESETEPAPLPAAEAAPDETLSEDDIMAIFGEAAGPAPAEEVEELPLIEQAFDLIEMPAEDAGAGVAQAPPQAFEADWLAAEAPGVPGDEQSASEASAWDTEDSAWADRAHPEPSAEAATEDWAATLSEQAAGAELESEVFAPEDEGESAEPETGERPSLFGLARAVEQAQQDEVPDWMAGLEVSAPATEDEELGISVGDTYDQFEDGGPADVPTYESAGHTGILQPDEEPEWMAAFAAEQEVAETETADEEDLPPDFAAADLVDEEPADALDAFEAAAQPADERHSAERSFDAIEWDMPGDDLILGIEPEPRAETDAEIPDWLSAITQSAASDADEGLPEEEDVFATGDAQAVPDWLREIEEPAADETWDTDADEVEPESLAPAGDLADTRSASPPATDVEDDFDSSFSFSDREPTWLRRASQWGDGGSENE